MFQCMIQHVYYKDWPDENGEPLTINPQDPRNLYDNDLLIMSQLWIMEPIDSSKYLQTVRLIFYYILKLIF